MTVEVSEESDPLVLGDFWEYVTWALVLSDPPEEETGP